MNQIEKLDKAKFGNYVFSCKYSSTGWSRNAILVVFKIQDQPWKQHSKTSILYAYFHFLLPTLPLFVLPQSSLKIINTPNQLRVTNYGLNI